MALVVDASAAAEILLGTARGRALTQSLESHQLFAPEHFPVEVASVVRGWSLKGEVSDVDASRAFADLEELGVVLLPVLPLLPAAFHLRHNVSMYDAVYVVLARALECSLITVDARLVAAAPDCTVTV